MDISGEVLGCSVPTLIVCCACKPTARKEKKSLELCMRDRRRECVCACKHVHVTMTTVFLIYDPHLRPGCRFVGGAEGGEAWGGKRGKKKQSGDSEVSAVPGPLAFMGPLKKKRERMNILPVLIDFSSSASPAPPQAPFLHSLKEQ